MKCLVPHLDFKGEILLHILDNHDEVGELDPQRLLGVGRAGDVRRAHVRPHDLEHERLDVGVRDPLDVPIPDFLVPNLKGLRPNTVQDRKKP